MRIDTTIIDAYLNSEDVSKYSSEWFYTDRTEDGISNVFQAPPNAETKREIISGIRDEIVTHAKSFEPCNTQIWDALVGNWRDLLEDVKLDLIVGFPEPMDATAREGPDGKHHMIFDLLCWEKYRGVMPLAEISQNLLTHELFHVMTGIIFPDIEVQEMQGEYRDQLDAIAFNEGFAHLVSYNGQEVNTVLWDGEELTKVYNNSILRMEAALCETNAEKQKQYIYEANFGNYYDKYAAMCGMIYLGRQWQRGGTSRLKELFTQGYHSFAAESAGQ